MNTNTKLVYILALFAILDCLFFGVIYAGWSSYVYILIDYGVYSSLCQSSVKENGSSFTNYTILSLNRTVSSVKSCKEQQEQLHFLYTVSTGLIFFLAVWWGPIIFKIGILIPKVIAITIVSSGCLFLGFVNPDVPALIVPGVVFVGLGGIGHIAINMRISSFLSIGSGFFVAVLSGACDSSVITLRIVKVFYDKGIHFKYPLVCFAVLQVLLSSVTLILHRKVEKRPEPKKSTYSGVNTDTNEDIPDASVEILEDSVDPLEEPSTPTSHVPLKKSILCVKTLTFYFALSIWKFNFLYYVGSINSRIQASVPKNVSEYTDILAYIMMCGLVTAFVPGTVFEWQGKKYKDNPDIKKKTLMPSVLPLTITCILGILLNILYFFTSGAIFFGEFAIFTLFRSFLYCNAMSFTVCSYPLEHQSVILPLGFTIGGLFSLIQIPVFTWYNQSPSSETQVRIFMMILILLTLVHPIKVYTEAKRIFSKHSSRPDRNDIPMDGEHLHDTKTNSLLRSEVTS